MMRARLLGTSLHAANILRPMGKECSHTVQLRTLTAHDFCLPLRGRQEGSVTNYILYNMDTHFKHATLKASPV